MTTPDARARLEKLAANFEATAQRNRVFSEIYDGVIRERYDALISEADQTAVDLRFAIAAIADRERLEDAIGNAADDLHNLSLEAQNAGRSLHHNAVWPVIEALEAALHPAGAGEVG